MKRGGFLKRKTPLRAKTPLKKKSTTSVTKLKDKLWQLCRVIIFKRYGDTCYSCNALQLQGANRQLGHFIPRSVCSAAMAYDLENLRIQCFRCNIHLSGNWPGYERHLLADGIDVEDLKRRNQQTIGMKADSLWYLAKIEEYTALL